MEYFHQLSEDEIKRDTLMIRSMNLAPDVYTWFEINTNKRIVIHDAEGRIIRKNGRIEAMKYGWRIQCGVGVFADIVLPCDLLISSREAGSIELDVQLPELSPNQQSFLPKRQSNFDPSQLRPKRLFPKKRLPNNVVMGERLNFRGLQHAPVNEQGVVFLFGMICQELGFLIEVVRSEYPDCEGKRCVSEDPEKWERVLIEFEFRSKNFKKHKHDPDGCDLIICWEHDWHDCPLDVIELKDIIKQLDANV